MSVCACVRCNLFLHKNVFQTAKESVLVQDELALLHDFLYTVHEWCTRGRKLSPHISHGNTIVL